MHYETKEGAHSPQVHSQCKAFFGGGGGGSLTY